jgi:hypothetical protein
MFMNWNNSLSRRGFIKLASGTVISMTVFTLAGRSAVKIVEAAESPGSIATDITKTTKNTVNSGRAKVFFTNNINISSLTVVTIKKS